MSTINNLFQNKKIIVFGTGNYADEWLSYFPYNVEYFLDNTPEKWGEKFKGKPIMGTSTLLEENRESIIILIASSYYEDISQQLINMGFSEHKHFFSINIVNAGQEYLPGHYYSPIPSIEDVKQYEKEIFNRSHRKLPGIEMNDEEQLLLLKHLSTYYNELPYSDTKGNNRYYFGNGSYEFSDAIILYSMIRHLQPKRIIEVGSGFSSAVMMDTNEQFLNDQINITFIEPYPNRLKSLFNAGDELKNTLIAKKVQEVDIGIFTDLEENDILFIDSSHVSKVGSDVNYLFFEVLPLLKRGVHIHVHDLFWPFEYPENWIYKGRSWNEAYLLRAFLQNNHSFKINFWNEYLMNFYENEFYELMPLCKKNYGGSLWIKKVT